jgi:hypothetical protein
MKNNGKQMDPHSPEDLCIFLKEKELIYGCGKPFKVIKRVDDYIVEKCEYI